MFKYIKFIGRDFLGLNNDFEELLSNQEEILEKLKNLEKLELENKQTSYTDYLTLKNLLIILILLSFLGGGFWLYNMGFFTNDVLESLKSLGTLSKDLHSINQNSILEALRKLNENSVNLSKEEVKLLLEIKNLLLKKGINDNISSFLNKKVGDIITPVKGGLVFGPDE